MYVFVIKQKKDCVVMNYNKKILCRLKSTTMLNYFKVATLNYKQKGLCLYSLVF